MHKYLTIYMKFLFRFKSPVTFLMTLLQPTKILLRCFDALFLITQQWTTMESLLNKQFDSCIIRVVNELMWLLWRLLYRNSDLCYDFVIDK